MATIHVLFIGTTSVQRLMRKDKIVDSVPLILVAPFYTCKEAHQLADIIEQSGSFFDGTDELAVSFVADCHLSMN